MSPPIRDPHNVKVGNLVRERRTQLCLTAAELGRILGYGNIYSAEANVYAIENGRKPVPRRKLKVLASTLGIKLSFLLP